MTEIQSCHSESSNGTELEFVRAVLKVAVNDEDSFEVEKTAIRKNSTMDEPSNLQNRKWFLTIDIKETESLRVNQSDMKEQSQSQVTPSTSKIVRTGDTGSTNEKSIRRKERMAELRHQRNLLLASEAND